MENSNRYFDHFGLLALAVLGPRAARLGFDVVRFYLHRHQRLFFSSPCGIFCCLLVAAKMQVELIMYAFFERMKKHLHAHAFDH